MVHSGFLEFKLDYSGPGAKNLVAGDAVSSKNVVAGGYVWRILCYPRGYNEEHQEYLSIFLQLLSESKNVKAIFDVFMMGRDGEPSSSHAARCVQVYPPEGYTPLACGFPEFVEQSHLESLYVTDGGSVVIMCGIIVIRDDNDLDVPPTDIGSHLGLLLDSADSSDVSFVVGCDNFPAHRAVLAARSPVFKAQLLGSMADAKMSSITLHDVAPATFKAMLRFMYTDDSPTDAELGDSPCEMLQHLLAAADRFALDRLKLLCARKLWDSVSVESVGDILVCAETYNCPELKNKCIGFIADEKNFKKAVLADSFVRLVQKFPSIVAELREVVLWW
ncbi:hypothetical protein U9M48_038166 [Paspalum notatum var. saurae]|uniref:Uncharacterized protein n=1 Tax=Paspalum notatum var. saurae TaxID=547442 RepID=A0AAQ3ULC0_PASNO